MHNHTSRPRALHGVGPLRRVRVPRKSAAWLLTLFVLLGTVVRDPSVVHSAASQSAQANTLSSSLGFDKIATYTGVSHNLAKTIGPGPTAGSSRLYLTYPYGVSADLVSVDVDTGKF